MSNDIASRRIRGSLHYADAETRKSVSRRGSAASAVARRRKMINDDEFMLAMLRQCEIRGLVGRPTAESLFENIVNRHGMYSMSAYVKMLQSLKRLVLSGRLRTLPNFPRGRLYFTPQRYTTFKHTTQTLQAGQS